MGESVKYRVNNENLRKGGGRPKGVLNKVTVEVRDFARAVVEEPAYVEALKRRLTSGKAPHMETLLFHYAYGKPKEQVELSAPGGLVLSWAKRPPAETDL